MLNNISQKMQILKFNRSKIIALIIIIKLKEDHHLHLKVEQFMMENGKVL